MSAAEKLDFVEQGRSQRSVKRVEPRQIDWVDSRLQHWAAQRFADQDRYSGAGGFGPSVLAAVVESKGVVVRSTAKVGSLMSDGDYEIDKAMRELEKREPGLHAVIEVHYCQADVDEAVRIARCGCSRRTYFRRIASGHAALAMLLPDAKRRGSGVAKVAARDLLMKKMKKCVDGGVALI